MNSIRKAKLDLESIHSIKKLCFHDDNYPLFFNRQLIDSSQDYFLVAQKETLVLGYVIGNHTKENDQGLLLYLGVHPDARGKNVGAKLAEQLVKLLENSQSREIFLTVHPNNAIAIKLYKKARFEVTATYDNYYLDDEPRVLITEQTV